MSPSTIGEQVPVLRQLKCWWQAWRQRRAALAEVSCCSVGQRASMARDLSISAPELSTLAGKWPDSADLLNRRMEQLKLDTADVKRVEPQVIRDLQRVCTLCGSKRRCARDLDGNPSDPVWQDYCPNTVTLTALIAERDGNGKGANR